MNTDQDQAVNNNENKGFDSLAPCLEGLETESEDDDNARHTPSKNATVSPNKSL